jgi:hypothetical protein
VPELAAVPGRAPIRLPVEDHAAADAGGDREVDHRPGADARAVAVLSGRGRGRVVLEHRRAAVGVLREPGDVQVVPAGQVQRREEDAADRVERPPAADPDRLDRGPVRRRLRDRLAAEVEQPLEGLLGPLLGARGRDDERVDPAVRVDDPRRELRPADVQREHARALDGSGRVVAAGRACVHRGHD